MMIHWLNGLRGNFLGCIYVINWVNDNFISLRAFNLQLNRHQISPPSFKLYKEILTVLTRGNTYRWRCKRSKLPTKPDLASLDISKNLARAASRRLLPTDTNVLLYVFYNSIDKNHVQKQLNHKHHFFSEWEQTSRPENVRQSPPPMDICTNCVARLIRPVNNPML